MKKINSLKMGGWHNATFLHLGFKVVVFNVNNERYKQSFYCENNKGVIFGKSKNFTYRWQALKAAAQMIKDYYSNKIKELAETAKQINFNAWVNSNNIIY